MHYLAYVLVPYDTKDIDEKVKELMAPFDKTREVDEYERPCDCILDKVFSKILKLTDEEFTKAKFSDKGVPPPQRDSDRSLPWTYADKEREDYKRLRAEELIETELPDPDCEECHGAGVCKSRENPDGEWDWYERGEGFTRGVLADSIVDVPAVFGVDMCPVADLDWNKLPLPHAVITPDGDWHSHCVYVLYNNARILDAEWDKTVQQLLERHKDALVVAVNYHM